MSDSHLHLYPHRKGSPLPPPPPDEYALEHIERYVEKAARMAYDISRSVRGGRMSGSTRRLFYMSSTWSCKQTDEVRSGCRKVRTTVQA